jgi:hypothetical protein
VTEDKFTQASVETKWNRLLTFKVARPRLGSTWDKKLSTQQAQRAFGEQLALTPC